MYARERWCPDVSRSRDRLTELGLEWTEFDIESDENLRAEMQHISGRNNVPTIVIGAAVLVEPSNAELDAALEEAGYPVMVR
jgi:glutaredoxin